MPRMNSQAHAEEPARYRTLQVSRESGATLRQLQWWDEQRLIEPWGKQGHWRVYTEVDLLEVKLVMALRRSGLSTQRIGKLLPRIRQHIRQLRKHPPESLYLTTDGVRLRFEQQPQAVVKHLVESSGMWSVVDLSAYARAYR